MSDAGEPRPDTRPDVASGVAGEVVVAATTCANCAAVLHGPFCAACGQEAKPLDPPIRHFAKEFGQELLDVDGRLLRSLRRLLLSPGSLTREHVEGRRAPWLSPLKLYLLASVAMFGAQAFAGSFAEIELRTSDDVAQVNEALQQWGYANLGELQRTIEAARLTWMPRVMFVLVPLFAGLVALVERRTGRCYPAHLVFALHVHAAAFAARLRRVAVSSRHQDSGGGHRHVVVAATAVVVGLAMFGPRRFGMTWGS